MSDRDTAIGAAFLAAAESVECQADPAEATTGALIRTAVEAVGCAIAPPAAEDGYTTTDLRDLSGADNPVVRDLAAALLRSRADLEALRTRVVEWKQVDQEVREYLGEPPPFPEPTPDPESRSTATLGGETGGSVMADRAVTVYACPAADCPVTEPHRPDHWSHRSSDGMTREHVVEFQKERGLHWFIPALAVCPTGVEPGAPCRITDPEHRCTEGGDR